MKKNLLLNPQALEQRMADPHSQELANKTAAFFESIGHNNMRIDQRSRRIPTEYYQFIKDSGLYATLLTPAGYGDDPDARWDHYRNSFISELLGFYGSYQYTFQVSVLGVGPVWMSKNEAEKKDLARLLKEGNVFAFGMSEREHGADLYANEVTLRKVGEGKYVANGEKYYIGNSSRAPKITVFGRDPETNEYIFWTVDCRERHYKYCDDIEVYGMLNGQLGYFELIEYPVDESNILIRGDEAFHIALDTINIGKTQTSFRTVGMATHALYEAINHSNNRYLYSGRVTDMPHIRRGFLEAWARILMARLYGYRAADYFRHADKTCDRRYMLFNPIQKSRANLECTKAVNIICDIMAAKAYETENFTSNAMVAIHDSARLEGTAHVNMAQAVKFINNYFGINGFIDLPEVPAMTMAKDDSANLFDQMFGKAKSVMFTDYSKVFAGCELPNVKIFLKQAELFRDFNVKTPLTKAQEKNADIMLNVAEIFGAIVYGQLVFEKARQEGIEDAVIDQLFYYLVQDINNNVLRQVNAYTGNLEPGQEENIHAILLMPHVDLEQEEMLIKEYVLALDGAYKEHYGCVVDEEIK